MKIDIKAISIACGILLPIGATAGAVYAFADDVLYLQSEADIHLAQDSNRICREDRAELIDLERYIASLQPPIPSYLYDQLAMLEQSVATHCASRA